MKKLKRFVLNDARLLSREELASVEGSLDIHANDFCTKTTKGEPCVYYVSYDSEGHSLVVLGTCAIITEQFGSTIIETPKCV